MSVQQELSIYFEGQSKPLPLNYQELKIVGVYNKGNNQATLEIERITLINEAAFFVKNYVDEGNIYEGLKVTISFKQYDQQEILLSGFLDLTDDYEELDPSFLGDDDNSVVVLCKVTDLSSRDLFRDKIEGNTYAYLETQGVFVKNDYVDIDFVIEDDFEPLKFIFLLFMFFSIIDKLQTLILAISKTIADIGAQAAQLPNGSIVALIYSIVILVLQLAYFVFLVATLFDVFFQIITMGISPVYQNKGQSLYSLISKAIKHFGYNFDSPIPELNDFYYMASLPFDNSKNLVKDLLPFPAVVEKGLPTLGDFGETVDQMIQIALGTFNCKLAVIGDTAHLRNVKDPYWAQSSTLILPDIKKPSKKNNAIDLKGTQTLQFAVDYADKWTTRNREGTGYEIKTTVKSSKNGPKFDLVKGLEQEKIPVSLMNRKTELNITEQILKQIAQALDDLSAFAGGNSDFSGMITDRIGVAKMTTSNTTVPKLVYMKNGRIPADHREVLGAKGLWEKYHQSKSWVANNFNAQEDVYEGIEKMPLDLNGFKQLVNNSIVTTKESSESQVKGFIYHFPLNYVDLSYNVPSIYSKNLKEEFISV